MPPSWPPGRTPFAAVRSYAAVLRPSPGPGRVAAAVAAGDEVAASVWREAVAALADGLVLAQALYDVELIVIGGGLAEAGETLLAPLRTAVKERLTFQRAPRLVPAAFGDEAGCVGTALLAHDRLPNDQLPDDQLPDDQLPDDQLPDDQLPDDQLPGDRLPRERE